MVIISTHFTIMSYTGCHKRFNDLCCILNLKMGQSWDSEILWVAGGGRWVWVTCGLQVGCIERSCSESVPVFSHEVIAAPIIKDKGDKESCAEGVSLFLLIFVPGGKWSKQQFCWSPNIWWWLFSINETPQDSLTSHLIQHINQSLSSGACYYIWH